MSNRTVLQCKDCKTTWIRQSILDDACLECSGEIVDITDTHTGQEFLRIIEIPAEIRFTTANAIYATGPSSLLSADMGKPA